MFEHSSKLEELSKNNPLNKKVKIIHKTIKESMPFIIRIAIAIYDSKTNILKTFLHSDDNNPLSNYQALLQNAPSLQKIVDSGKARVVNDLRVFDNGENEHTRRINSQWYEASYTMPIYNEGIFLGFIFFNSNKKNVFNSATLNQLDLYGHIISLTIIKDLSSVKMLTAAVKTTRNISHLRDPETGKHLDRMSRYSLIIATSLAEKYNLDDDYIEHIFMFAPLHDIGKIAIPDHILLKPGRLDEKEKSIMQTHTNKGREMIDDLLNNFDLINFEHVDILRNIAEKHHEAIDGTGYPYGMKGDEIPLEARIVAVADIFDALTSSRSYKKAWSNEDAFAYLKKISGEQLDEDCVNALLDNMDKVLEIQEQFSENSI